MTRLALISLVCWTAAAVSATAAGPSPTPPGQVQLPLDDYTALLRQASDPSHRPAPAGWALGSAEVAVQVTQRESRSTADVRVTLTVDVLESEWSLVPVLPAGTAVRSVTVGGKPVQLLASPGGLAWSTNVKGAYTMVLSYEVDARRSDGGGSTIAVPLPRAASIRLKAELPGTDLDAAVIPAAGVLSSSAGGKTSIQATVPAADGVQITWREREARGEAISRARYTGRLVGEAIVWNGELGVDVFHDQAATLDLLPRSVTLGEVRLDGERATIFIDGDRFATRLQGRGKHVVAVEFETPVVRGDGPPRVDFRVPSIPVSRFELTLPGKKELSVEPAANVTTRIADGSTVAVVHLPLTERVAFHWSEAVPEDLRAETRANAAVYHTTHADEGVLFVRASVVYEVTRGETNQIELVLPDDVQINRINSESGAIADWRIATPAEGPRVLTVFLDRQLRSELEFDVDYDRSLRRDDPAGPFNVPLLQVIAVQRQRGMVALLSSNDLTLEPVDEGDAARVGENQLPPFVRDAVELTVAHTYKYTEPPRLVVRPSVPERVHGRFDAQVDTLVSLGDVTLTGSASVEVHIKSGRIMDLRLALPTGVSLLGLTAPSLRTYRVQDEPGGQRIDVEFTQEMEGQIRLDLTYERILDDGRAQVEVPTLAVHEAQVEQGRIAVEALTAVELAPAVTSGLTLLDVNELPQQLVLRTTNPILLAYKYVHADPPHRLALEVKRHGVLPVQEAAIDQAAYKTLFTSDGLLVTTAEFTVRNSRKQFLEVRLPANSEVWSVFVDGKPEKPAVARDGEGEAGRDVLVKIINSTRPFQVSLIYGTSGRGVARLGRIEVALPEPDILVTRSRWDVYLPDGLRYAEPATNMDLVTSVSRVSEDEMRAELSGFEQAAQPRQSIEPLRISVPTAGVHFALEKLYANQDGRRAWLRVSYATLAGARISDAAAVLGTFALWVGVALALLSRRRTGIAVGAGGALLAAAAIWPGAASLTPSLIVSVAALLVLLAGSGRRLLTVHRTRTAG